MNSVEQSDRATGLHDCNGAVAVELILHSAGVERYT